MVHLKVKIPNSSNPPYASIIDFEMPSDSTILDLKQHINSLYPDIDVQSQLLTLNGQTLKNSRTIESYEIEEDHSVINLRIKSPSTKFFVQIVGTRDFEMAVRLEMKVPEFKKKIADELGVPSSSLDFYHRNDAKGLKDQIIGDDIIGLYGIDDNSTIEAWDVDVQ